MLNRADSELGFLLKYENIAWYTNGEVKILDRRIYPTKIEFVTCKAYTDVVSAIANMVTQSAGPYTAAAMGMAMAAYECSGQSIDQRMEYLNCAANAISHARPTTTDRMKRICNACLVVAAENSTDWDSVPEKIVQCSVEMNNARYTKLEKMAEYLVDMLPSSATIMTQCFAETIIGQLIKVANKVGKRLKFFCCETRPYLQGARLTASLIHDMGGDATVITDNMAAYVMKNENISVLHSAADIICGDGTVVNKIGTMQLAILAKHFGIPYYVTGAPDQGHATSNDIKIEHRDAEYVLQAMGVRTAMQGVRGYYPAFDVTPAHLVSAVITDIGAFVPTDLTRYYKVGASGEY